MAKRNNKTAARAPAPKSGGSRPSKATTRSSRRSNFRPDSFPRKWLRISPSVRKSSASCRMCCSLAGFDDAKLSAFVALYNDLMLAPSGLSEFEREMIAVAVSSYNQCYYCLVAHGAAVRQLSGDPPLGELMAMNYRAARLSRRRARHARLCRQADRGALAGRGRRPRSVAPRGLSPTATSGTLPQSPASSTCPIKSLRPPTCGQTASITGKQDEAFAVLARLFCLAAAATRPAMTARAQSSIMTPSIKRSGGLRCE